jgi:hypothetical protein
MLKKLEEILSGDVQGRKENPRRKFPFESDTISQSRGTMVVSYTPGHIRFSFNGW